MKRIELTINGKPYSKEEPTVQDWYDNIEALPGLKDGISSIKGMDAYIGVVSKYMGIPKDDIKKNATLKEITTAYDTINANLLECFGTEKEGSKN